MRQRNRYLWHTNYFFIQFSTFYLLFLNRFFRCFTLFIEKQSHSIFLFSICSFSSDRFFSCCRSGHSTAGPCPLKVISSAHTVHIYDLACKNTNPSTRSDSICFVNSVTGIPPQVTCANWKPRTPVIGNLTCFSRSANSLSNCLFFAFGIEAIFNPYTTRTKGYMNAKAMDT